MPERKSDLLLGVLLPRHLILHSKVQDARKNCNQTGSENWGKTSSYDALLLDLKMPTVGGLEVIARVRASGDLYKDIPIIVSSADASLDTQRACTKLGADAFLSKPINTRVMVSTIENMQDRGSLYSKATTS